MKLKASLEVLNEVLKSKESLMNPKFFVIIIHNCHQTFLLHRFSETCHVLLI